MSIISLSIKNFQSHKDTKLKFHKGVNAIIGPSDSGKTAIFRALRWVIDNRPAGKDFHSWWDGDPRVQIMLDDGVYVTRERIKDKNIYKVDDTVLKAFGQKVPPPVQEALNLTSINFQWQMDASFLLSQSSGEVSRYLNEVVNLESIDLTQSNIERRLRKEKRELDSCGDAIERHEENIESYDWLPGIEKELKELESLDRELSKLVSMIIGLDQALIWLSRSERELAEVESILKFEKDVDALIALEKEIEDGEEQIDELVNILDLIDTYEDELKRVSHLAGLEGELNKLFEVEMDIEDLEEDILFLSDDLNSLKDAEEELVVLEHQLDEMKTRYDGLMPDVCPLCEQPIKKKSRRGN
jgi:exonuclease SbcC